MIYTTAFNNALLATTINYITNCVYLCSSKMDRINNKIHRFAYNFLSSCSAAIMFRAGCLMRSQTIGLAYTWQKVVLASIIAIPFITRLIAYCYSKDPLDKTDRLDRSIGCWLNIANTIAAIPLLGISKPKTISQRGLQLVSCLAAMNGYSTLFDQGFYQSDETQLRYKNYRRKFRKASSID